MSTPTVPQNQDKEKLLKNAVTFMESVTTKRSLKDKLCSRKFLFALAGVVTGILGMIGLQDNIIGIVSFAIVELGSIIGYIIAEGRMDISSMKQILETIGTIIDKIGGDIAAENQPALPGSPEGDAQPSDKQPPDTPTETDTLHN